LVHWRNSGVAALSGRIVIGVFAATVLGWLLAVLLV
jgi:hypothetical protein